MQQKVERLHIASHNADTIETDSPEQYNTNSDYALGSAEEEEEDGLEDVDIDETDGTVTAATAEQKDNIHPDMQQFDAQPTQYQFFRRKSIIPVDETVSSELFD